ncbi:hypothetical protein C8P63_10734 [Melghirimyces profundicolus]|uniref:Uncharacterized protein n=1 Tax=Melghirimyces profundicolus TaxID=1242148 RepID=A0A2T6BYU5_9BACL|nr:hypothetical protein [Melghirimyces profundicolus]PTX61240.1 hypothetical protein C8P63_10734 [Melghirimyces profundicolus]
MKEKAFYRELAKNVNQILGRKAVTSDRIVRAVGQAKYIRQTRGKMALIHYLHTLKERLFSESELERLKQSPRQREFSYGMLDILVYEKVITPAESRMLKRMVP